MQVASFAALASRAGAALWQSRATWRSIEPRASSLPAPAASAAMSAAAWRWPGRNVTLLLRPALADAIARHGLRISDLDGADRDAAAVGARRSTTDPATRWRSAEIVLVTVKSGATAEMAELIAQHAPPDAVVVSLQNGVGNRRCAARAPRRQRSASSRAWCPSTSCRRARQGERAALPSRHQRHAPDRAGRARPARRARRAGRRRRRACRHAGRAVGQAAPQSQQRAQRAVRPAARRRAWPTGAGACCSPRRSRRRWPC